MKTDARLAIELLDVIEIRRELAKRETELKNYFKTRMANLSVKTLALGGVLISLVEKSRTSMDKKALVIALGADTLSKFGRMTTYFQIDVKEADSVDAKLAA